jgi:Domain of unknown function (DUF3291)
VFYFAFSDCDAQTATARQMHLAQVNVARLSAPLDSPQLADFVAALEPINALGDASPGFVWRLQTDDGDATAVPVLDDDSLLVNLSVGLDRRARRVRVPRPAPPGDAPAP